MTDSIRKIGKAEIAPGHTTWAIVNEDGSLVPPVEWTWEERAAVFAKRQPLHPDTLVVTEDELVNLKPPDVVRLSSEQRLRWHALERAGKIILTPDSDDDFETSLERQEGGKHLTREQVRHGGRRGRESSH